MLPGIINQVNLDWDENTNYYIPTIKRHNNKLYIWLKPNGPDLSGANEPSEKSDCWLLLDFAVHSRVSNQGKIREWNEMKTDGKFFIQSVKDETLNAPENITAWWWLEVSTCENKFNPNSDVTDFVVLQVARLHPGSDNAGTLSAKVLSRGFNGSTWSNWAYNYAQYSA